jgi:hypothetical protein
MIDIACRSRCSGSGKGKNGGRADRRNMQIMAVEPGLDAADPDPAA